MLDPPYPVLKRRQIKKFPLTPLCDSDGAENKDGCRWSEDASSCLTVNFAHTVLTVFPIGSFHMLQIAAGLYATVDSVHRRKPYCTL